MSAPRSGALIQGRIDTRRVLGLAWPIMISMLSYTAMTLADSLFVGWLGTEPLAAVGLAATVTFLALSFGMGLLRGVKVLVAQRTGARDIPTVRALAAQSLLLAEDRHGKILGS